MSMMTPEDDPNKPGRDPGVHPDLAGLNSDLFTGTEQPHVNAFVSMYKMMPERHLASIVGYDVVIDTGGHGQNPELRVVAAHGDCAVAIDRTAPRQQQTSVPYRYLYGSIYTTTEFTDGMSWKERTHAWQQTVGQRDRNFVALENGHMFTFSPGSLCRDAMLAYSPVYGIDDLRSREQVTRVIKAPLHGCVIAVPIRNKPTPFFVETDVQFTEPMKNAYIKLDNEYVSMLDFVTE